MSPTLNATPAATGLSAMRTSPKALSNCAGTTLLCRKCAGTISTWPAWMRFELLRWLSRETSFHAPGAANSVRFRPISVSWLVTV